MIDNDELARFRKEKLPMYLGIINNSVAAQELYECSVRKQRLLRSFKKLNKQYTIQSQKLYDEFELNKKQLMKQIDRLTKTIEELQQVTKKEKGE